MVMQLHAHSARGVYAPENSSLDYNHYNNIILCFLMCREGKNNEEKAEEKPKANPASVIKLVSMNTVFIVYSRIDVSPPND